MNGESMRYAAARAHGWHGQAHALYCFRRQDREQVKATRDGKLKRAGKPTALGDDGVARAFKHRFDCAVGVEPNRKQRHADEGRFANKSERARGQRGGREGHSSSAGKEKSTVN